MATGDIASRSNPLSDIQSILDIFKGKSTTSTSSEIVSSDKANAYIKQILESTQGLAAVAGGQKAAGMYNSTVNTQLTNDLLSRVAANTAALSSVKTNTVKQNPQMDLLKTLGSLGMGQIFAPIAKAGSKKLGLDKLGNKLADSIFGNSGEAAVAGMDTPASMIFSEGELSNMAQLPVNMDVLNSIPTNISASPSSSAGIDTGVGATSAGTALAMSSMADAGASSGLTAGGYVVGSEGATWGAADAVTAAATSGAAEAEGTAAAAGATDAAAAEAGSAGMGAGLTASALIPGAIIATAIYGMLTGAGQTNIGDMLNGLVSQVKSSGPGGD